MSWSACFCDQDSHRAVISTIDEVSVFVIAAFVLVFDDAPAVSVHADVVDALFLPNAK